MSAPEAVEATAVKNRLTERIYRRRRFYYLLIALLFLSAFNGHWRIGRDTSLYRSLAHSLATGKGYSHGVFASHQIYPGYPLLLAGLEKVFGRADLPPLLMMYAMAAATMVLTYRLICLHYPRWIAIAVIVLMGFNARFLALSNELLTDVPFLLGLVMALYGWERLRICFTTVSPSPSTLGEGRGEGPPSCGGSVTMPDAWAAIAYLLAGLIIAASMRPTFWVLALAWVLACVWGLWTGPRKFYAAALLALLVVVVTLMAVDPRTRGFHPFGGGYEREAADKLRQLSHSLGQILGNTRKMLARDFPAAIFGNHFASYLMYLISPLVLSSSLLLFRRHVLWGLLVPLTVGMTLVMSTAPRYYLMILPFLLLGWILLLLEIIRRMPQRRAEIVLASGLLLVLIPNISRIVRIIADQRYRNVGGMLDFAPMVRMANLIRQHVPEDAKVIGPEASILAYHSDRLVYMQRDLLPYKERLPRYPRHIADLSIEYAVFPSNLYREGEAMIGRLMNRGVIVPTERIAATDDMVLAKVKIVVPEGDWRKLATTVPAIDVTEKTPEQLARAEARKRKLAAEAKARKEAGARAEIRAHKEERLERQSRAAAQARKHAQARAEAKVRKERVAAGERMAAKERAAAKARKEAKARKLREQRDPPATLPGTNPSATFFPQRPGPRNFRRLGGVFLTEPNMRDARASRYHASHPEHTREGSREVDAPSCARDASLRSA